jgi:DNA-binding NarL/FixJ family response regulator
MSRRGPTSADLILLVSVTDPPARVCLSAAEKRILRLAMLGCGDGQIARILGRSQAAVRRRRARAMKRLGEPSRRTVVRWLIDEGLSYPGDRLSPSERGAASGPHDPSE